MLGNFRVELRANAENLQSEPRMKHEKVCKCVHTKHYKLNTPNIFTKPTNTQNATLQNDE